MRYFPANWSKVLQALPRLIGLLLVTLLAAVGMYLLNASWSAEQAEPQAPVEQEFLLTATPVSTLHVEPETIAVQERYSGRIRPLESFVLSFEIGGRLQAFGKDQQGNPLDEGARVRAGQPLARLDNRHFVAVRMEAEASLEEITVQMEQAQTNLARVESLQAAGSRVITPEEYDARRLAVRELQARRKMAEARLLQAEKNLDDAAISSPVDGVISRRHANPGEALNPHQAVLEILQVDEVLLVVGVPDTNLRRIRVDQPVEVEFLGRDGRGSPYPAQTGRVRRIPEAADAVSGLFEIEILLPNPLGDLRPGTIGLARITTEVLSDAFRLPIPAVIFRTERGRETASIYTVTRKRPPPGEFVKYGEGEAYAREFVLDRWIEQGQEVILTDLPAEHREVVVRGQYGLVPGRPVEIINGTHAAEPRLGEPVPVVGRN